MDKELIGLLVCCILAAAALVYVFVKARQYEKKRQEESLQEESPSEEEKDFGKEGFRITDHIYMIGDEKHVVYESKSGAYFIFRNRKRDNRPYRVYVSVNEIL